jgi:DNA-binding transcriptional LysR family regulator
LEQVRWAESSVESLQAKPQGLLRMSAPVTLGACMIAPLVANYLEEYPQVQVELALSNTRVDLIEDGYDLAVRIGTLGEAELVAKSLPPYKMSISASPAYLKRKGMPTSPADLAQHDCLTHLIWSSRGRGPIGVAPTELTWPPQGKFSSNDGQALRAAALQGGGLLLQPEVLVAQDLAAGRLVSVLDQYVPPPRPVHLVYLPDFRPRPKLTSLVNYLLQHLGTANNLSGE